MHSEYGVNKPKILQVASGCSVWGGTERYIVDLATGLLNRGCQVVIACRPKGDIKDKAKEFGIPTLDFYVSRLYDFKKVLPFNKIVQDYGFNIIHIHSYFDYIIPAIASRMVKKTKVILTRHSPHKVNLFHAVGSYFIYHRIVAVSNFVKEVLLECGVPSSHVEVIHNGITTMSKVTGQDLDGKKMRIKLGIHPHDFLVLGIGRITYEKGFHTLVDAILLCQRSKKNISCVILGDGPDLGILRERISSLDMEAKINLLGFRSNVQEYYAIADVVVVPSISPDSFPYAVLEAMAMHKPVIGTNVGGIPEMLADGAGILVPPDSPHTLAGAILQLADDDAYYKRMVDSTRKRIVSFSFERMINNIEAVYLDLLGFNREIRY